MTKSPAPQTDSGTTQASTRARSRACRVVGSLAAGIALATTMLTGTPIHAEPLDLTASRKACDDSAAPDAISPSAPGWYVIVDEDGNAYSPEAEAAHPELAANRLGITTAGAAPTVTGWHPIVGEDGEAYSPEAEAFNPALASLP